MIWMVAAALPAASVLVSLRAGLFSPAATHWSLGWSLAAIALLLTTRAVGDFKLVGFFKRVRGSRFAVLDTWVYLPLCAVLALGTAVLTAA